MYTKENKILTMIPYTQTQGRLVRVVKFCCCLTLLKGILKLSNRNPSSYHSTFAFNNIVFVDPIPLHLNQIDNSTQLYSVFLFYRTLLFSIFLLPLSLPLPSLLLCSPLLPSSLLYLALPYLPSLAYGYTVLLSYTMTFVCACRSSLSVTLVSCGIVLFCFRMHPQTQWSSHLVSGKFLKYMYPCRILNV